MIGLEAVLSILSAVVALLLGGLVASRGSRRVANLAFAGGMLGLGIMELGQVMLRTLEPGPARVVWAQLVVGGEAAMMPAWAVFGVTFAAADAMAQLRRWRWLLGLAAAASLAFLVMAGWQPFVVSLPADPYDGQVLALTSLGRGATILSLLTVVFVLFHLESTLRNSAGLARWTIKYFVLGLLGLFGTHVFVLSHRLLYRTLLVDHFAVQSAISLLSFGMVGVCVIRNRLLQVDVFISRYVAYRSVAVGAVGAYMLSLGLASGLVQRFGVSLNFFFTALLVFVSAMTLMVGLLSETVRRRVKRAIVTHFYRHKYDYRQEWAEFTAKVASVESPDRIPPRVLERVTEIMGIREGAIWLVEEKRGWRLAASVGLPAEGLSLTMDPALLAGAAREGRPVILLEAGGPFTGATDGSLRDRTLTALVPLITKGEVVGLLALGTSAGRGFGLEDEELLGTVAAQAATVILNARLTEQLVRAKELEALHRVSSFALHDLKNLVATLSLVTQNAAERGNDPAFQRDAFRAVEGSVKQMRELIARLSDLPKTLDVRLRPTDVNDLVHETVERMKPMANGQIKLVEELSPVPSVLADKEHLQKALYNLMLNAVEAITGVGQVRVRTTARNGSVLLEVADTGQGIPEALLSQGLFTPFKSTKRRGLGIGLYQVKTIVEAHGGRITVESRTGEGTTFSVDLPLGIRAARPA